MTIERFVERLAEQGVRLRSENGDLIWSAPWGFKDRAELAASIRERKAELLRFFAPQDAPGASPDGPPAAAGVICPPSEEVPQDYDESAAEEQAFGEIACEMPDGELIEWILRNWGCELCLDDKGRLKAKDAGKVPQSVKAEVRGRARMLEARLKTAVDNTG